MAILVTGGAGYIGSVNVALLRQQGETVVVLDNLGHGHRQALDPAVTFYHGDVGDAALVRRLCAEQPITACLHFAALIAVGESVLQPEAYYENNVAQGIVFVRTLLAAGVRHLVFSSTAATYGEPQRTPIAEDHPQLPTNPYGWSKLMMERVLDGLDAAHGFRFVALRYFNASGAVPDRGEDHRPETHLLPNILLAALGRRPALRIYGTDYPTPDGTCVRDYIHVADLAAAHLRALAYLRSGGASVKLNVGTGRGYSVQECVQAVREVTGRDLEVRPEPRRPGDSSHLVADPTRARAVLGWTPQQSDLPRIVRSAWDWHRAHPDGYPD